MLHTRVPKHLSDSEAAQMVALANRCPTDNVKAFFLNEIEIRPLAFAAREAAGPG